MSVPQPRRSNAQPGQPDFNTLDEPIKETIVSFFFFFDSTRSYEIRTVMTPFKSVTAARFESSWC